MGIFDRRTSFKPFEFPDVIKFKEAMQHSYWLVSEWNFVSDVQDFHTKLTDQERNVIKNTLLAISQIEVSVKKFWTKLGDRFPKPEFEQVGVTFGESECYDDQTEVLTETGWVRFSNLPKDIKVAQYDIDNGEITFVYPTNYVERNYTGVMHHYNSTGTNIKVTPNHELLVMHPAHNSYVKKLSCKGIWAGNYRYPIAGVACPSKTKQFQAIDKLLIAIQADGSLYGTTPSGAGRKDFCFNLKKLHKIEKLENILLQCEISYTKTERNNGFIAINGKLPSDIDVFKIKDFSYINLNTIDYKWARSFIEELGYWDCNRRHETNMSYYSSREEAVDKVQAIALLANLSTNKTINRTAEQSLKVVLPDGYIRKTSKTCYVLNIVHVNKKVFPERQEVNYNGNVYCVTVPKGNIVTRREGRVAIAGNCRHSDAYSHLLETLNLNDDFALLLQNPVIQGRVDYLTKYLKGASDNSNQNYTLTLALFSMFIENVSLFSQFAIVKAFNKEKNCLKDIDNVIQATLKEETCHALFGAQMIKYIQAENPEWFDKDFYDKIIRASKKAYTAECGIIDWIFEQGELEFLSKETLKEFIKYRLNESVAMIGCPTVFEIDQAKLKPLQWFNEELHTEVSTDFFFKRPVTYSKRTQSITADDLF